MRLAMGFLAACFAAIAVIGTAAAAEPIILISNDDGYEEKGLRALAAALNERAIVIIAAPKSNQSGMSSAIAGVGETVSWGAFDFDGADQAFWIHAKPAVAVMWGWTKIEQDYGRGPDIVLSGINSGANLGASIYYSGTVGAAREGAIRGAPSVAFSLATGDDRDLEGAAARFAEMALSLVGAPECACYLNINAPTGTINADTPIEFVKAHDAPADISAEYDEKQKTVRIIARLNRDTVSDDTDIAALARGAIAVTPVRLEMTDMRAIKDLKTRIAE